MAPKPFIYQINTRVWLTTLSARFGYAITLANVPGEVIAEIASFPLTHVWLMGVWTRSAGVRASALKYKHEYEAVLPDVTDDDVIGSAYAIGAYEVDPAAGGRDGLAAVRQQFAAHGLKLILDFVPNHVAIDHPAIASRPEIFVRANAREHRTHPGMFFPARDAWNREIFVGHGRDPHFPAWIDTAQLNAFSPAMRQFTIDTLRDIASQCDGVRCDMAMLMMNEIFERTWGWAVAEDAPALDFWNEVIPAVRADSPNFLFMAEVYWNLDYPLQQQGFDYTYDKVLYDRMVEGSVEGIRQHLLADVEYLKRTVHFIENHDEPRIASAVGVERSRPLAAMIMTVPGAVLLHDGQFVGRKAKLPVQISRQPDEPLDRDLQEFYRRMLRDAQSPIYTTGTWRVLHTYDAPLLAYGYHDGDEYRVVVANLNDGEHHATVDLTPWGSEFVGRDVLTRGRVYTDTGYLQVFVPRQSVQILQLRPVTFAPPSPLKPPRARASKPRPHHS